MLQDLSEASDSARNLVLAQRAALAAWIQRCSWAQRLVACLLVAVIGLYAVLLHMIETAANTEERADSASPRTAWSSKRHGQVARWREVQQQLASKVAHYQPASPYDDRSRLVLFGDSITESWQGTSYGEKIERASGTPVVLQQTLGQRWLEPVVLGISGDQTQHLLWRLAHGELVGPMARDPRLLVVLLIGTNNLAAGHSPEAVARGVLAVVTAVLNQTRGRVLVNAVLPRGDGVRALARICPPHCNVNGQPHKSFMPAVDKVNDLVAAAIGRLGRSNPPPRARFVDCGSSFDSRRAAAPPSPRKRAGEVSANQAGVAAGEGTSRYRVLDPRAGAKAASELASEAATNLVAKATQLVAPEDTDAEVVEELMPDRLHPNARGHRLWARCLTEDLIASGWERTLGSTGAEG